MTRDDWMLLSLTFLTGIAIGMYVYIAAFKPVYAPASLNSEEQGADDWSIVGKRRSGEDGSVQPSFRLLHNGDFVFLPGGQATEPVEGSLPGSLVRALDFTEADLAAYSRPVSGANCASRSGGFDYEYRITIDGDTTVLDTCTTALGEDSELAQSLEAVWQRLEGRAPTKTYDTPSELIQGWIRENLGVKKE